MLCCIKPRRGHLGVCTSRYLHSLAAWTRRAWGFGLALDKNDPDTRYPHAGEAASTIYGDDIYVCIWALTRRRLIICVATGPSMPLQRT